MTDSIRPSPASIPQEALDDLRRRLAATRWPPRETVGDWSQGVPLDHFRELMRHWETGYDWRRCERMLNGWNPCETAIDGTRIHFFHIRSPEPDALPLVMTHGWPGSVVEFGKVVGPLTDPARHGGDPADAFHLVLPSLPGYGFSDYPTEGVWNVARIADAWGELMLRLGYGERWVAQGGDWGSFVSTAIGAKAPAGCRGIHLNFISVPLTEGDGGEGADPMEREAAAKDRRYDEELAGYNHEQSTRPQTLGYALADSPSGQAAWIYEKFHDWTDHRGTPETVLSRDEILDNISIYWLTNTATSSARLYWARRQGGKAQAPVGLPAAISLFPKDIQAASRRQAARVYRNIVSWRELDRGGHFAAFEQPEDFVREVRDGLRGMRG